MEGQGKSVWSVWFFFSLHCGLDGASGGSEPDSHRSLFSLGHFSDSFLPQANSSVYVE